MAILKTIRYETFAGSPDYFDDSGLEFADYFVITDTGKAYAVWGVKDGPLPGWYAAAIECTTEGSKAANIWRRLNGASMSPMESNKFHSKKELMDAIANDTILLIDRSGERELIRRALESGQIPVPNFTPSSAKGESAGCLALLAAIGLSTATLATATLWLMGGA
jgi:hypothetical protein